MENNIFGSFDEYLCLVHKLVNDNRLEHNKMGRSIRCINFSVNEVYPNKNYFKECFESNLTPEESIENLCNINDELLRYVNNIPNSVILEEVSDRYLTQEILSDADTDDLEDELRDRWDSSLVNLCDVSDSELMDELNRRKFYSDFDKNETKAIISEALGFNNSFGYTVEEAIEEIKKIW